jgi:protein PET117
MSSGSRVALALASIFTATIVYGVHYKQVADKAKLHQGIVKDVARQEAKKNKNIKLLQEQQVTRIPWKAPLRSLSLLI